MRFPDFLRVAVLLFGGAATVLAVVTVVGVARNDATTLALIAAGWWGLAALIGGWLGRRMAPTPGIARLLASARSTTTLPEAEPGSILFNRLWPLIVITVVSGVVGVFFPQVPAIAAGYALLAALTWRKQASAVVAIEERDGVRFFFDRTSPFGGPRLLRTPWARKIDPVPEQDHEPAAL
jgi:hypothetical protein